MKARCGLAWYMPARDELQTLEKTRAKELLVSLPGLDQGLMSRPRSIDTLWLLTLL
jgi:hypothetical protein